jgi:hypothetical protein
MKRHAEILSVRLPQGISAARVELFTKENVNKFFDLLEPELKKINFDPNRLYSCDETGVYNCCTTQEHKSDRNER